MADIKINPDHIVRGPWKDVNNIPDTDIYSFIFRRNEVGNFPPVKNPDLVAFIDAPTGKKLTLRDLKGRVDLLARGLSHQMKMKKNDVVCFYMPNNLDYPTSLWAVLKLGGVPSCANPTFTPTELVHQLKVSKSKYILTHPLALQVAKEAASQVGIPESKIFVIIKDDSKLANVPDLIKFGEKAPEITPLKLAPGESKKRVALLNFSSGTSGLPKGVLITHYNVIANVCQLWSPESSDGNPEGKVSSGCLPFYHIYGLIVLMHAQLVTGRTVVVQPSFSPDGFVADIHKYIPTNQLIRYKITTLYAVPPILLALLHRVPHEKMVFNPPLESICCAAAPLPKDVIPAIQKIWPGALLRQGWGMTETATGVTLTSPGSPNGWNHTCGAVVPNAEAIIVDPGKKISIAPGKGEGELWVRAPSVTLGYIDNAKETEEMFDIGGQRWMRSGDAAEFERGKVNVYGEVKETWVLCIRDRLKELIKVSGNQVAPAELENLIASHPAVADQAVVGKPDDRRGEIPWAFVVKKKEVSEEEIMEWVRKRTTKYKHLGGVEFVEAVAKNPSGKILRRIYREQFKQELAGKVKAKL